MIKELFGKIRKKVGIAQIFLALAIIASSGAFIFASPSIAPTYAVTTTNTNLNSLNISSSSSFTLDGTTLTITATGVKDGCSGAKASTTTVTLKNTEKVTGKLTFDYTFSNGGSAEIGSSSASASGSYNEDLGASKTLSISVTSKAEKDSVATIILTKLNLSIDVTATTTFVPSENGSFTVDGVEITTTTPKTQSATKAYSLVAIPKTGYTFLKWTKDGKDFSYNSSFSANIAADCTITALFYLSTNATFGIGDKTYGSLSDALSNLGSNKKIVVKSNGRVGAGNYTIPSGVTLLIPYNESETIDHYNDEEDLPAITKGDHVAVSFFRTLTFDDGVILTVSGILSVPATMSALGQYNGTPGCPHGPSARLILNGNSKVILNNGSKLYCWGFITGTGSIEAKSGSKVYECFQMRNYRGGTITSNVYRTTFPFNQYFIQNIEVSLKLFKGSQENLCTAVNITLAGIVPGKFTFIGSGSDSDDAMFKFNDNSSDKDYIVKYYDSSTDRLHFEASGNVSLSPMEVSIKVTVNSAKYQLPLCNNISIKILSGSNVQVSGQQFTMLPGVEMEIEENATLKILNGSGLLLYDRDEWIGKGYVWGNSDKNLYYDFTSVKYSPTQTYTRQSSDLTDAKLIVNGKLEVASGGYLLASEHKGKIVSNNGGQITIESGAASSITIKEVVQNTSNYAYVSFGLPVFTDEDGTTYEITSIAESQTIYYRNSAWTSRPTDAEIYNIGFVDNNFPTLTVEFEANSDEVFVFPTSDDIFDRINQLNNSAFDNAFKESYNNKSKILIWQEKQSKALFVAGQPTPGQVGTGLKEAVFEPIFCGWIELEDGYRYIKRSNNNPSSASILDLGYETKGIKSLPNLDGDEGNNVYLINDDGFLDQSVYGLYDNDIDGQTYYLQYGEVIKNFGLVGIYSNRTPFPNTGNSDETPSYYYVGQGGFVYKNGKYKVDIVPQEYRESGIVSGQYYMFDADGKIIFDDNSSTSTIQIDETGHAYFDNGSSDASYAYGYGAVEVVTYNEETEEYEKNTYFVQEDGTVLTDTTQLEKEYVSDENDNIVVELHYYTYDENGVRQEGTPVPQSMDEDGNVYFVPEDYEGENNNHKATGYGLFELGGYLYYAKDDGTIVKNGTFYVDKINGCNVYGVDIKPGLYYFDESGRMYDSIFNLIEVVSDFKGLFELNGYLYYVKNDGTVAKDETININNINGCTINGDKIEPDSYYFDKNGRLCDDNSKAIVIVFQ